MREKHVLKEGFRALVPEGIAQRAEQIYGAPVSPCFVNPEAGRAHETLSTWSGACMRIFRSRRRGTIGPKLKKSGGASAGACEDMSALDIVSVQLLTISS